jgi:hypothetical protein
MDALVIWDRGDARTDRTRKRKKRLNVIVDALYVFVLSPVIPSLLPVHHQSLVPLGRKAGFRQMTSTSQPPKKL